MEVNTVETEVAICDICASERKYDPYGDVECLKCGQVYGYTEGHSIELSTEQLYVLKVRYTRMELKEGG